MRLRASMTAAVLAASSVAFGVVGLGAVETDGGAGIDAHKLPADVVDTTPLGTLETGFDTTREANMAAVAALELGPTTDMQFQRRTTTELVDGEEVQVTRDLAFVGISDVARITGPDGHGFAVVDVTDPAAPVKLAERACGGFHNDVAVWRDYLVLGHDGFPGPCDGAPEASYAPGISVFDVSDPTDPVFVRHFTATTGVSQTDVLLSGVHNIAIHPDGIVHYAAASFEVDNPGFGYLDLNGDPAEWENVAYPIRDISPSATDGCHDMGYSFSGDVPMMVCPAIGSTLLWDITDPKLPTEIAVIPNPAINIHHGGRFTPDGSTVVLGDELAGAGGGEVGGTGGKGGAPVGALFTYDLTVPQAPVLTGYASASENLVDGPPTSGVVTSHFYNFVPNAEDAVKVVTGWYSSGMVVHDLSDVARLPVVGGPGVIGPAPEVAHLEPTDAQLWHAYAYRGHVFANSYTGNTGLFVASLDGYTGTDDAALAPYCNDVGIVWGPSPDVDDWRDECRDPGDA